MAERVGGPLSPVPSSSWGGSCGLCLCRRLSGWSRFLCPSGCREQGERPGREGPGTPRSTPSALGQASEREVREGAGKVLGAHPPRHRPGPGIACLAGVDQVTRHPRGEVTAAPSAASQCAAWGEWRGPSAKRQNGGTAPRTPASAASPSCPWAPSSAPSLAYFLLSSALLCSPSPVSLPARPWPAPHPKPCFWGGVRAWT